MDRKLTAILAMDVVGFSRMVGRREEATVERLKRVADDIVEPAIARASGRLVKRMGDGFLAEFASVVGALACAVKIQEDLAAHNRGLREDARLRLRMGLHMGDVIVDGDDILGDGVNVAARLESFAAPGAIALSAQVHDHIAGRTPYEFTALGPQEFKNLGRPIDVYSLTPGVQGGDRETLRFDDFELDFARFELRQNGVAIHVEPLVFDLLRCLAENADRVIARDELIDKVWEGRIVSEATISSAVKTARKALGDSGEAQKYIRTVRGRGVQFVADIDAADAPTAPDAPERAEIAALAHEPVAPRAPEPAPARSSFAIPAFEVFGDDASLQALADGLVDNLTTLLGRGPMIDMVSRKAAFKLRDEALEPAEIGARLGVRYVLEGSAQRLVERVRVNLQLIATADGRQHWAQQFDRADDEAALEGLLHDIAPRLEAQLSRVVYDDLTADGSAPTGALMLLKASGLLALKGWRRETFEEAADLLRQAIALDPTLALAHAHLSLILGFGHRVALMEKSEAVAMEAIAQAERALDLDSMDSTVISLSACALSDVGQPDRAVPLLKKAIELNPNNGHAWAALGVAYAGLKRFDEVIAPLSHGIAISPLDSRLAVWRSFLSVVHIINGNLDKALRVAEEGAQADDRNYFPRVAMAAVHIAREDRAAALRAVKEALRVKPDLSEQEVLSLIGHRLGAEFITLWGEA